MILNESVCLTIIVLIIAGLEAIALLTGHDGKIFLSVIGTISFIAGYVFKIYKIKRNKKG